MDPFSRLQAYSPCTTQRFISFVSRSRQENFRWTKLLGLSFGFLIAITISLVTKERGFDCNFGQALNETVWFCGREST